MIRCQLDQPTSAIIEEMQEVDNSNNNNNTVQSSGTSSNGSNEEPATMTVEQAREYYESLPHGRARREWNRNVASGKRTRGRITNPAVLQSMQQLRKQDNQRDKTYVTSSIAVQCIDDDDDMNDLMNQLLDEVDEW